MKECLVLFKFQELLDATFQHERDGNDFLCCLRPVLWSLRNGSSVLLHTTHLEWHDTMRARVLHQDAVFMQ